MQYLFSIQVYDIKNCNNNEIIKKILSLPFRNVVWHDRLTKNVSDQPENIIVN